MYHNIKPIFVFDGPTPEIKRHEVLLRRKRREQFGSTFQPSDEVIQRMAKRLLAKQLNIVKSSSSSKQKKEDGEGASQNSKTNSSKKTLQKLKSEVQQY
jgi:5'-3' exonuclease